MTLFQRTIAERTSLDQQEFLRLIDKYLAGKATEEETALLFGEYKRLQQETAWDEAELGSKNETEEKLLSRLMESIHQKERRVPFYQRSFFKIAAAIFLLISTAFVWLIKAKHAPQGLAETKAAVHVPAVSATTLFLEDGTAILFDKAPDGLLARSANTSFKKQGNQLIVEQLKPGTANDESTEHYNTFITAKGRQCQAVLADGSKVWLNAASSLRFPALFAATERKVDLVGEAYFEVTKSKEKPFRVYAATQLDDGKKGVLVEVLGTHFNINAYDDEAAAKTTLLEGSVKISAAEKAHASGGETAVLTPGQQAEILPAKKSIAIKSVDVDEVIAWKSNLFFFNNADIQTIMRQLSRWYDVEVVFEGSISPRTFSGKINRSLALPTVLKILEQSNIHFRTSGKRIVVGT